MYAQYEQIMTLSSLPESIKNKTYIDEKIKKIRCGLCGKNWFMGEDTVAQLKFCPYCGQSLLRIKSEKNQAQIDLNNLKLEEAIYLLYKEHGKPLFANTDIFLTHLTMVYGKQPAESLVKSFRLMKNTDIEKLYDLFQMDAESAASTLNELVEGIIEDCGIQLGYEDKQYLYRTKRFINKALDVNLTEIKNKDYLYEVISGE